VFLKALFARKLLHVGNKPVVRNSSQRVLDPDPFVSLPVSVAGLGQQFPERLGVVVWKP